MKVAVFTLALLALLAGVGLQVLYRDTVKEVVVPDMLTPTSILTINATAISVAVADTEDLRVRGLSLQPSLPEDTGLLFIFPQSGMHGIWMRNMKFPIDIIWFDEDFRIIDIHHTVTPDSYPEVFTPKLDARYIVEVSAGFSEKHHISVGDTATVTNK